MKAFYLLFLLVLQERRYLAVLPCEMKRGVPDEIVNASEVFHYNLISRARKLTADNILTRENIMVILQRKNIDPNRCSEAQCAVEYARLLGADRVVTCSILRVKDINYIYLHLYEADTGRIINSVEEKTSGGVEDVIDVVGSLGEKLFMGEKIEKKEVIKPEKPQKKIEGKGIIFISSQPEGAYIVIDDKDIGERTPTIIEIDEGWHDIKLIKEGYVGERKVYVQAGKRIDVEVILEKGFGFLKVESEPEDADVYVDGEMLGKTPFFKEIEAGKHKIRVEKKGYSTKDETVNVEPDKKTFLKVRLKRKIINIHMNFRLSYDYSPFHPNEILEGHLHTNVRIIGPLYANLGIGGGNYPEYSRYNNNYYFLGGHGGFHFSSGFEVQYPLLRKKFSGLYYEPISLVGGFKYFEYIHSHDTNNFGVSVYGGINLLYLYFGIGYRIMTSEECDYDLCDPSGFFLSFGLRLGF